MASAMRAMFGLVGCLSSALVGPAAWSAAQGPAGPAPSAAVQPISPSQPAAGALSAAVPAPAGGAPLSAASADAKSGDYVLGVADKVRVTVYNEANLTGEFPVNANGAISMPLIGDVPASGKTAGSLRDDIAARLADGYLKNPRVAIDVLTFRPFYILGEVSKAGEYPFSSGLTVMNAVATAQGFTYRANKKYVYLKHAGQTSEERVRLTSDLMVQPGDTIRIAERFF